MIYYICGNVYAEEEEKGITLCFFLFLILTGGKRAATTSLLFLHVLPFFTIKLMPLTFPAWRCSAARSFLLWLKSLPRRSTIRKPGKIVGDLTQSQSRICVRYVLPKDYTHLPRSFTIRSIWHLITSMIHQSLWTGRICNVYVVNVILLYMASRRGVGRLNLMVML